MCVSDMSCADGGNRTHTTPALNGLTLPLVYVGVCSCTVQESNLLSPLCQSGALPAGSPCLHLVGTGRIELPLLAYQTSFLTIRRRTHSNQSADQELNLTSPAYKDQVPTRAQRFVAPPGFEPGRPCGQGILNPPRLPFQPRGR